MLWMRLIDNTVHELCLNNEAARKVVILIYSYLVMMLCVAA